MGIRVIRNQRINLQDFEERRLCEVDREYCTLFETNEYFRVQAINEPCGGNQLCNPDFDLGAEILTNGTFTGSASGWTLTNMTYSSNKIVHTSGAGIGTFAQALGGIVAGKTYILTIKVDTLTGGNITINLYDGAFATISSVGTHVISLTASTGAFNPDIHGLINNGVDAEIDFISLKTVDCWVFDDSWSFSGGLACHSPGTAGDIYADLYTGFSPGRYIQITYSVFGMSDGTLTVKVGGATTRVVTQNGTYTDWMLPIFSDTYLKFSADSDFDGCIEVESSYRLLDLTDLSNAAYAVNIETGASTVMNVTLNKDRINFNLYTGFLPDGCYRITVQDPCGTNYGMELNADTDFNNAGIWTIDTSGTSPTVSAAITGGQFVITNQPNPAGAPIGDVLLTQTINIPDGVGLYALYTDFLTGAFTEPIPSDAGTIEIMFPGGNTFYIAPFANGWQENTQYVKNGNVFITNTPGNPDYNQISIIFHITGTLEDDIYRFLSASIQITPALTAVYNSNCLKLLTDTQNTKLIMGESDTEESHGFLFDSLNFPNLDYRNEVAFQGPRRPNNNDGYLYSSGRKKKNFSQNDKQWELVYISMDENGHDVVSTIMSMDHFYIGEDTTNRQEYYWDEKTYEPDWGEKSGAPTAESKVLVSRIDKTTFK